MEERAHVQRIQQKDDRGDVFILVSSPDRQDDTHPDYFEWRLYGSWKEEDLAPVEEELLKLIKSRTGLYNRYELYDGEWGNRFQFVFRYYGKEYGPFLHGDTPQELIRNMRLYYQVDGEY